jgi:hypothetical protein
MASELYYFVPGEVILHLEHDEMAEADLEETVNAWLKTRDNWMKLTCKTGHIITFPYITGDFGKVISLVVTTFDIPSPDDYESNVQENQQQLIDFLITLHNDLGEGMVISDPPYILLRTVTANSLTSCTPHQPATGGPGSQPSPANSITATQGRFYLSVFDHDVDVGGINAGDKVSVAILDTAPWTDAYKVGKNEVDVLKKPAPNAFAGNSLLHQLLGSNLSGASGTLKIIPYKPTWRDFCFSLTGHADLMPDHGLFVSGIIHSIVPHAQLKLYEVLNPYGAGSYESLCSGLAQALSDYLATPRTRVDKLIINLSLVVNLPSVLHLPVGLVTTSLYHYLHHNPGISDVFTAPRAMQCIDDMSISFREIITKIAGLQDVLMVAAAGNDATEGARHWARYPAAFPGVIGVGAVPVGNPKVGIYYQPASYSNFSDQPPATGYMTLGGEGGVEHGVRGVYLHDFPTGSNTTGWAWWAGTSFAAPIISGLLAIGWSNNWNFLKFGPNLPGGSWPTPNGSLMDKATHFLNRVSYNKRTRDAEKVIEVTQN